MTEAPERTAMRFRDGASMATSGPRTSSRSALYADPDCMQILTEAIVLKLPVRYRAVRHPGPASAPRSSPAMTAPSGSSRLVFAAGRR